MIFISKNIVGRPRRPNYRAPLYWGRGMWYSQRSAGIVRLYVPGVTGSMYISEQLGGLPGCGFRALRGAR